MGTPDDAALGLAGDFGAKDLTAPAALRAATKLCNDIATAQDRPTPGRDANPITPDERLVLERGSDAWTVAHAFQHVVLTCARIAAEFSELNMRESYAHDLLAQVDDAVEELDMARSRCRRYMRRHGIVSNCGGGA